VRGLESTIRNAVMVSYEKRDLEEIYWQSYKTPPSSCEKGDLFGSSLSSLENLLKICFDVVGN